MGAKPPERNRPDAEPEFISRDNEVLHPYLGFVRENSSPTGTGAYYGFLEAPNTWIQPRQEGEVVIGVFGGSVANFFYQNGGEELIAALKKYPRFHAKTLRLVPFAMGGYKQPQQLFALNYYLSLDGHLDIAVNLDGFNELVLPIYENIPKGVFPFYPRVWFFRLPSEVRAGVLPMLGQISYLQQKRSEWTQRFTRLPFRYSAAAGLLWRIGDKYFVRRLVHREQTIFGLQVEGEPYAITGPYRSYRDDGEMMRDLVEHWARNSLLMDRMSRANGIQYFHFLQPTGRYIGSKPLTAEEKNIVFTGAFPPTDLVNAGYPLLREAGARLRESGISFTDLSMMFRGTRKQLYFDVAHVVPEGSQMMARAIAGAIMQGFGR